MDDQIRVLVVEDSEGDLLLLQRELRKGGYAPICKRVETRETMQAALDSDTWDIIIADYSMPKFSAPAALEVLKQKQLDIPFIILSGNIGEDIAVAAMKAGAHDYIMKGNLARLIPAIERELREAVERRTRREAEKALRESEERYSLAVQGANDGLWDWDLKKQQIYFASRWKWMLGHTEDEIGNSPEEWFRRVHLDDRERLMSDISAHLEGISTHFQNEHRMLHNDGVYRWMLSRGIAVRDGNGTVTRMAGSQTDITDRKRAEEQLLHDAFHDALTGMPNRALFMDRLGLVIERARQVSRSRNDYLFAVLFLDLDRFKVINDSLGHRLGDQLLVAIAKRLNSCMRPGDTVARLGGDEFAILAEDIKDVSGATRIATRIQHALNLPFRVEEREVFTSASIGIAVSGSHADSEAQIQLDPAAIKSHSSVMKYERPEDLLRDADVAMYRAKARGKARYEIFDHAMHEHAVAILQMENELRVAVERNQLRIHYQPIISLKDGRLDGFEALVRWEHPRHGLIFPADFISLAEETGIILQIDRWVLSEACQQLNRWQTEYAEGKNVSMTVNLSAKQFSQPDLVQQIQRVLSATKIDPRRLRLEITESVIMDPAESITNVLVHLKNMGLMLSLDDFGTGYSSLSCLHRYPIDTLKIDRSFVHGISADPGKREIVRAIKVLAKHLGMVVIAEGIETAEDLAHLRTIDCEAAQGFLFSRPVNSELAGGFISRMLTSK
jgi:diguanylate cyclase (GGDEF)-like protein/PAS domain S-box-containing protein